MISHKERKQDEAEYGWLPPEPSTEPPVHITEIDGGTFELPPVDGFEEEIAPNLTATEQRTEQMEQAEQRIPLDMCQEYDLATADECGFRTLEGKQEPDEEDRLLETIQGSGYSIQLFQCDCNFRGILRFNSGPRVEKLFGSSRTAILIALHALGTQGVTVADLTAGEPEVSNAFPSKWAKL
jgi:hypothetical protein